MIKININKNQQGRLMKLLLSSHNVFCLTVLVCVLSFHAQAKDNTWYVSGALGQVSGSQSANEIKQELSRDGVDITDVNIDDSRAGWQVNLGYDAIEKVSIEIGYLDLGHVDIVIAAEVTDPKPFINNVKNIHPNSAHGFTIASLYNYDINDDFTLSGKVGLFNWRGDFKTNSQLSINQIDTKNSSTDLYYGLNGGYKMTKEFSLFIEWTHFELDNDITEMWSLGGKFKF